MRLIIILLLNVFAFSAMAQTKQEVLFKVEFVNSYCGGARPTPEIIAELSIPRVLTNSQILLIPVGKKSKKAICMITNEKGEVKTKLSPGTYSVKMGKKYDKTMNINYDSSCSQMSKKVWETIELKQDQNTATISLVFQCNPCLPPRP